MKTLSTDERKLLIIGGLDILAASLAGIFVTVFFYAHGDLKITTLYNIAAFASMTFFYGLSGWMLRYVSSGVLMKASLVAGALFYLLLFILKEQSIAYVIPLGILSGFSGGLFWAGYNLNQYIISQKGKRLEYFGWGGAISNFSNAAGPVIGGLIIAMVGKSSLGVMNGYLLLFLLVAMINVITVLAIGKLPTHGIPHFSYWHLLTHKRTKLWKLVLGQQALLGLYDVSVGTVTGVLVYVIVKNEALLGSIFTIGSLCSTAASILAIRVLKKYPQGYWLGSVGLTLSIFLFIFMQHSTGAWMLVILSGCAFPLLATKLSHVYFAALDVAPGGWQNKYHMMLERDIVLGLLRTVSYIGLFVFLGFGDEIQLAKLWLFILPLIPLAIGFLLHRMPGVHLKKHL